MVFESLWTVCCSSENRNDIQLSLVERVEAGSLKWNSSGLLVACVGCFQTPELGCMLISILDRSWGIIFWSMWVYLKNCGTPFPGSACVHEKEADDG